MLSELFDTIMQRSLSLRRAWIEIKRQQPTRLYTWSLSLRRAWIEIGNPGVIYPGETSLSLRRAWIEIVTCCPEQHQDLVALLTESVD